MDGSYCAASRLAAHRPCKWSRKDSTVVEPPAPPPFDNAMGEDEDEDDGAPADADAAAPALEGRGWPPPFGELLELILIVPPPTDTHTQSNKQTTNGSKCTKKSHPPPDSSSSMDRTGGRWLAVATSAALASVSAGGLEKGRRPGVVGVRRSPTASEPMDAAARSEEHTS